MSDDDVPPWMVTRVEIERDKLRAELARARALLTEVASMPAAIDIDDALLERIRAFLDGGK